MPATQDGAAEGLARAKGALMREAEADQVRGLEKTQWVKRQTEGVATHVLVLPPSLCT